MGDLLALGDDGSRERATGALKKIASCSKAINAANVLSPQGFILASSGELSKEDLSDREYFKRGMNGEVGVSEPFMSKVTNKPVLMFSAPVKVRGKIMGVLSLRVDLSKFSEELIDRIKPTSGSYAYLMDKTGLVFAHPDKSLLLTNINEFDWGRKIMSQGAGRIEYEYKGVPKSVVFDKDATTGWTVAININPADISLATAPIRNANIFIGIVGVVLVSLVVFLVVRKILINLNACVAFSETVAEGDLDRTLGVRQDDEIGVLADSLRKLVENLKIQIQEARQKGLDARQESERAKQAMSEARQAQTAAEAGRNTIVEVSGKVQEVVTIVTSACEELSVQTEQSNRGADEQVGRVGEIASAMEQMNATVLQVAQNAGQAVETAEKARHKAEAGASIVTQVVRGIAEVQKEALDMKTDMTALGRQAQGIGQIMNVISDIADQTNLLALNAAIEAARAGDAGRGFAVVADEVRKLAEKTMAATKEVGDSVQGIQNGTRKNIEHVDQAVRKIDDATNLAGQSGEALGEIVSFVELTTEQVRSIAAASGQQASASEDINRSVEEVNRISAETAEAMKQSAQAVVELTGQAQVLKSLVDQMQEQGGAGGRSTRSPRALVGSPKRLAAASA